MSGDFSVPPVSAGLISRFREETGASMSQAKAIAKHLVERESLKRLMAEGTMEDKVSWLLDKYLSSLSGRFHPADAPLIEAFERIVREDDRPEISP